MKMQDLIDFIEKDDLDGKEGESYTVSDYLNQMGENGKQIVISKISQRKFMKYMTVLRVALAEGMKSRGQGDFLTMAEAFGELEIYTNTVVLVTLGVLVDEEVI